MAKYENILFDLDGTITDPGEGITNSVAYALNKYGINVADRKELYKFIGPPLAESFEKYYGFSETEARNAVEYYREYYRDKGIFENLLIDGFENLLENLESCGKTLIVATSKPEVFAKQVLEHFNIARFFKYIAGGDLDGTRTKKDEIIAYALEACDITDKSKTIMIGDRELDIIGAKKAGIDSIGVLFGYGDRTELENAGATYIVENIDEIEEIIVKK